MPKYIGIRPHSAPPLSIILVLDEHPRRDCYFLRIKERKKPGIKKIFKFFFFKKHVFFVKVRPICIIAKKNFSLAVVGVVGLDGIAESVASEVGVDLSGRDTLMPQHLLHGAQVGTVLDQLGGEAMA